MNADDIRKYARTARGQHRDLDADAFYALADVVEAVDQSLHSGTFNAWNAEAIRQSLARVEALKP